MPGLIGAVFLVAALSKLHDPRPAMEAMIHGLGVERLDAWHLLGPLIAAELLVGTFLLFGIAHRISLLASMVMLVLMSGFLLRMMQIGSPTGCGCLFRLEHISSVAENWLGLGRNTLLLLMAAFSLRFQHSPHGGSKVHGGCDVPEASA